MIGTKIDNTWALHAHMNERKSSNVSIYTRSVDTDEVIK
jgi:hypothetical protein